MDDDEGCSSGLSGWAMHELGRQAERSDQSQARIVSAFAARLRGEKPVNVGRLLANNEALWQQNQNLLYQIDALKVEIQGRWLDVCDLREWARSEIQRLTLENATLSDLANN